MKNRTTGDILNEIDKCSAHIDYLEGWLSKIIDLYSSEADTVLANIRALNLLKMTDDTLKVQPHYFQLIQKDIKTKQLYVQDLRFEIDSELSNLSFLKEELEVLHYDIEESDLEANLSGDTSG